MHYPDLPSLISDAKTTLARGPIALVLVEDDVEIAGTIVHHLKLGFRQLVLFCPVDVQIPDDMAANVHRVDFDVTAEGALAKINNAIIKAAPGQWIYYCYNAEYLMFPFCETRSIGELLTFMTEERRDSVMSYTIDLYARDLTQTPTAVDPQAAYFDRSGYFALARQDDEGNTQERQMNIHGGLRWRFEEHVAKERQRLDRSSLYRAVPGLQMAADGSFSEPEHNTVSCPWHNNLTVATASFRTAKALRRNPGSKHAFVTFYGAHSETFSWSSQQLLDLGLIEPGQWF
ncbi:hypothetical protein DS901_13615 [Loktanella sp. D2R18]|uniref:hypothetical protein n=1 Tax=Rhodobacterales TaxID=204455 RepID=UPI000DE806A9|nr:MULTISPECIES: hypothetical protein [Rhodobacterales]MDO6588988.1 hypothetical protein [Yoonia sp. 1_MG-2023]RBW41796.1 hypothetical protein DS901_13615 [Loktanella sp. D2R18]